MVEFNFISRKKNDGKLRITDSNKMSYPDRFELQRMVDEAKNKLAKSISKKTVKKPKPEPKNYNKDLVEFMKKMYARILVEICNHRVHDEDNGCDFEYVSMRCEQEFDYKGKQVKLVYLPVEGIETGYCTEAVFYVNCPPTMKFTDSTLAKIKMEFRGVREMLVKNFNEIRELAGGKWFEKLKTPVNTRHILHLFYDLYYKKDENCWKCKFKPNDQLCAPDGGRWIPYDVKNIYEETNEKEEMNALYGQNYGEYGYFVAEGSEE